MATQFSTALQMSNSTAVLFRAWVQFIDDALLVHAGSGWVNTADTGQLTISGASAPGAANTKVGYRIYHMNDTLQATSPLFMRLDFGSGSATSTPGVWITLGTGSNGSGTITGVLFNGGASATPNVTSGANGTNACDSYSSGDTNRIAVMQFVRASANDIMMFGVERSKDTNGNDTAAGFYIGYSDAANGLGVVGYVNATPGSQPAIERPNLVLSNSSAFGSDVGIGLIGYFNGIIQPYGLNFIFVNSTDFAAEASLTMSVYGTSHTFQLGNSGTSQILVATGANNGTARIGCRAGIRYE